MDMKRMIGQRLKNARNARHLSQEDLAGLTELSKDTISKLERGAAMAREETLDRLARALSVAPEYLRGLVEDAPGDTPERAQLRREISAQLPKLSTEDLRVVRTLLTHWVDRRG